MKAVWVEHPPLVEVRWVDCATADGWTTVSHLKKLAKVQIRCVTVGYLVHEEKDVIVVVQTLGWDGRHARCDKASMIPRAYIRKMKVIQRGSASRQ